MSNQFTHETSALQKPYGFQVKTACAVNASNGSFKARGSLELRINLNIHIDRRVCKRCGAVMQPSGATSKQTCTAPRQGTGVRAPTDHHMQKQKHLSKRTWPCSLPVARIGALVSDGTMIMVEHQPPPAFNHKHSVKLFQTKPVPNRHTAPAEEGWGCSRLFCKPVNWHIHLMQHSRGCHASCMQAGSVKP